MEEETVTVGDQEVTIRETEDGFEAVEADTDPEPGLYVKFNAGSYGAMLPVDADFVVDTEGVYPYNVDVAWHPEDNVDNDMRHDGYDGAKVDGYDGHAIIAPESFEIVMVTE